MSSVTPPPETCTAIASTRESEYVGAPARKCSMSPNHFTSKGASGAKCSVSEESPDDAASAMAVETPGASDSEHPGLDLARFRVLEVKGQWIRVARLSYVDPASGGSETGIVESTKDKGWLKIRDASGKLRVWFVSDSDADYR
jgi:hypothetical protein